MMRLWHAAVKIGKRLHRHLWDSDHCRPPACVRCGATGWPKP